MQILLHATRYMLHEKMEQKKLIIISVVVIALVLGVLGIYIGAPDLFKSLIPTVTKKIEKQQPKVIEEQLTIPESKEISITESRGALEEGNIEVPLVPKSEGEKVIVPKAALTVKDAYALATIEAQKWSADSKLIFVKSLGAVTLEGKSSQWQLAFSSSIKKDKGYEVIVQEYKIVSQKEIDSTAVGADLPRTWMDSREAIATLQEMPQYSNVSVSSINFFYNADAKEWRYGLATSIGVVSIRLH